MRVVVKSRGVGRMVEFQQKFQKMVRSLSLMVYCHGRATQSESWWPGAWRFDG